MQRFSPSQDHILFGHGAETAVVRQLTEAGARGVLVIAQERHRAGADRVARALADRCVGVFTTELPQVPGEVADAAVSMATAREADWVVAHGGGTAIGVAKMVALQRQLPLAAIPTTFSGSERTDIWGVVRDGQKSTGRSPTVRPRLVAYDPQLLGCTSPEMAARSLVNAMAHSVEALYAVNCTEHARQCALDSLQPLREALVASASPTPQSLEQACRGAWLAGEALGGASMALHHKLAHVLGGSFGTAHAATHALLLPYTLHFNAPAARSTIDALRQAWGTEDPSGWLYDIQRELGLPTSLRALGIGAGDVEEIAQQVLAKRYDNPRIYDGSELAGLLLDALHDRRPSLQSRRRPQSPSALAPHAGMDITERGAPLEQARVVVIGVHGRGASADRFLAQIETCLGPQPEVCLLGIQASENSWYPRGYRAPLEDNQPGLESAISVLEAAFEMAGAAVGPSQVVVVGFSQGACTALTWLSQTLSPVHRLLAWSGAHTPLPHASFSVCRGVHVFMSVAADDPWVQRTDFESSAARFVSAGAHVISKVVPGDDHRIHSPDMLALRHAVEQSLETR